MNSFQQLGALLFLLIALFCGVICYAEAKRVERFHNRQRLLRAIRERRNQQ